MKTQAPHLRKLAGTTLIEILVVIVVFLVGILAVVQIFPKGFQILLLARSKEVAQQLARDQMEQLQARPDELPEQIVAAHYDSMGNLVIDSSKDPNDLGPIAASIDSNGIAYDQNNNPLGYWPFYTGSNIFRRVIGEGRRVPAPSQVGATAEYFGGLMLLQYGPINYHPGSQTTPTNISVYGNDLEQIVGLPTFYPNGPFQSTQVLRTDYQYFIGGNPNDNTITVSLPTGQNPRQYQMSFSAYVTQPAGGVVRRDYSDVLVNVPVFGSLDASGQYPLFPVQLLGLTGLVADPNIQSIDLNTLRIERDFAMIPKGANFDANEPYEFKLINENLGVLLFNPVGHEVYVSRSGVDRQPLQARVDYDVYDWRIIHDDFRVDTTFIPGTSGNVNSPQILTSEHKLAIGSLKVAGIAGPDGIPNTPIIPLETVRSDGTTDTSKANAQGADNFVLVDEATGGVFYENSPTFTSQPLITLDKSSGIVTIKDEAPAKGKTSGIQGELLLPDGTVTPVVMDNRAVRALYMTKQEYSVQVLKAASQYTIATSSAALPNGQFYVGGTVPGIGSPWRIYFPRCDDGRKVTLGQVDYDWADGSLHSLTGQDFQIKVRNDLTLNLPSVDLTDVDSNATAVDFSNGIGVRSVKGASVAVRVLWNPDSFILTTNTATNLDKLNVWGRGWRHSTNETYLQRGENIR